MSVLQLASEILVQAYEIFLQLAYEVFETNAEYF